MMVAQQTAMVPKARAERARSTETNRMRFKLPRKQNAPSMTAETKGSVSQ